MGKKIFRFFRIWGNLVLGAITVYPFLITYFIPSQSHQEKLTSLFGWSWVNWLIIFLVSIIVTFIVQILIEKYDNETNIHKNESNSSANHGSIAMQEVNNSTIYNDSFNAFNTNVPEKFYKPTREQIAHQIGVEIQKFSEQFKRIRHKPINDKFDEYLIASKAFELITTELLPHATIALHNNSIIVLINEIQRQLTRYSLNIGDLSQEEANRLFYGKHSSVPRDVLDRINDTRKTLDEIENNIDTMVKQIIDLSREIR